MPVQPDIWLFRSVPLWVGCTTYYIYYSANVADRGLKNPSRGILLDDLLLCMSPRDVIMVRVFVSCFGNIPWQLFWWCFETFSLLPAAEFKRAFELAHKTNHVICSSNCGAATASLARARALELGQIVVGSLSVRSPNVVAGSGQLDRFFKRQMAPKKRLCWPLVVVASITLSSGAGGIRDTHRADPTWEVYPNLTPRRVHPHHSLRNPVAVFSLTLDFTSPHLCLLSTSPPATKQEVLPGYG